MSEAYPDLKANENFRDLQVQLEGTENRIATARGRYTEAVAGYNTAIKKFPTVIYAGWFGFTPQPQFKGRRCRPARTRGKILNIRMKHFTLRLLPFALAAMAGAVSSSCNDDGTTTWEQYKEWRQTNLDFYEEQKFLMDPDGDGMYYQTQVAP